MPTVAQVSTRFLFASFHRLRHNRACAAVQDRRVPEHEELAAPAPPPPDNIWAAIEAADVQRVQALIWELPERARQARPADGRSPLHAAAAVETVDDDTDQHLARIMRCLVNDPPPQWRAIVNAVDHGGQIAWDLLQAQADGNVTDVRALFLAGV